MANITRIKASDGPKKKEESDDERVLTRKKVVLEDKKSTKKRREERKRAEKAVSGGDSGAKKPFILWRPFVALGHYLRDSWRELRQVRWPNRKSTWQMVLAVLVYSAIFMILISVLDLIFTSLSNLIFKG